jgi:hypothetical protein
MIYLRNAETGEFTSLDLTTAPVGTVVESFAGRRFMHMRWYGWRDVECGPINASELEEITYGVLLPPPRAGMRSLVLFRQSGADGKVAAARSW